MHTDVPMALNCRMTGHRITSRCLSVILRFLIKSVAEAFLCVHVRACVRVCEHARACVYLYVPVEPQQKNTPFLKGSWNIPHAKP